MVVSLVDLTEAATAAEEPALTSSDLPQPGGVDPLGLRQINFDPMGLVFPGINNVAWHIRPFTVVTWAWRRAAQIADNQGMVRVPLSTLRDFVDRIEVAFAWSQFRRDPNSRLPGHDVLAPLLHTAEYRFGGDEWERRKKARAYSTALSAPINYGPALKTFGWLRADLSGALLSTPIAQGAMTALDVALAPFLEHPMFSQLGDVRVSSDAVVTWAEAWAVDRPTEAERRAMAEAISGDPRRRDGAALVVATKRHLGGQPSIPALRRTMCGAPTDFHPSALQGAAGAWRTLQFRQAFRLALESLFYWVSAQLEDRSTTTTGLARQFLAGAGNSGSVGSWFAEVRTETKGPADWIEDLQQCFAEEDRWDELPTVIRGTLAACLAAAPISGGLERQDRLPLARAAHEAGGWRDHPVAEFLGHVLDSWVFGQHVYWAVGRGLADARARGRTILRLKVTLEEQGWTLTPGASVSVPRPTADRLETMVNLMQEADVLTG